MIIRKLALAAAVCTVLAANQSAHATEYEVTVTNLTHGLHFTPLLLSAHPEDTRFFYTGEPSSPELQALAEGGDTTALAALLESVSATVNIDDTLLAPGESRTFLISNSDNPANTQLSIAGMLLPTNDGFVGLNSLTLPTGEAHDTDATPDTNPDDGTEPTDVIEPPGVIEPTDDGESAEPPEDDMQDPEGTDDGIANDPENNPELVDDSNPDGDSETDTETDETQSDDASADDAPLAPPDPFAVVEESDPEDTEEPAETDDDESDSEQLVDTGEGNDSDQVAGADTETDSDSDADADADEEMFPVDGMHMVGESITIDLLGYDAGTEGNDEMVGSGVPGEPGFPAPQPVIDSGVGSGATGIEISAEGFVHVHRNVLGDSDPSGGRSDINSAVHRWLNPVARVTVTIVGDTAE
jgi:hypothetical protein